MKYFLSIFLLSFCISHLSAQEKHFVFIQSDSKQPFYVSVNGKLYSSTASGYVIIPKLADGDYNFTIGFAQNAFPEQTFSLPVQNKDLGFDLKNFNEKGWGLFNLQSLDITMASSSGNSTVVAKALSESANAKAQAPVISFEKKKDTTQQLSKTAAETASAGVTKDDGLKDTQVKADLSVASSDKTTNTSPTSNAAEKSEVSVEKTNIPSDVKKVSEVVGEGGVQLTYVEGSGKTKDTVNIIIPSTTAPQSGTSSGVANASKANTVASDEVNTNVSSTANKSDMKFLDISMSSKKDSAKVTESPKETTRIMENSNCKNVATDEDYAKLRKKMAMETTDDKMISEAKKFYRNKCFTTSQIKGLSTLFLSDEGRLKFFDASFVSVADATQYSTLQTEFIDPAFVTRFKTLIQ